MKTRCAYCGIEIIGEPEHTIHRDGFDQGPEVPLCLMCGDGRTPDVHEIWAKIANPEPLVEAIKNVRDNVAVLLVCVLILTGCAWPMAHDKGSKPYPISVPPSATNAFKMPAFDKIKKLAAERKSFTVLTNQACCSTNQINLNVTIQTSTNLTDWRDLMTLIGVWATTYETNPPMFYRCRLSLLQTNSP